MTTIEISINGQTIILASPCSLSQALYAWSTSIMGSKPDASNETTFKSNEQNPIKRSVIALNQTFVPRNHYDSTRLTSGDIIELLSPMAGG
ncbi:MAG: thiamine biosynthesis protein ThiS [Oleispira sp.]|jgi:thiamine biosynthesis protein ThiS